MRSSSTSTKSTTSTPPASSLSRPPLQSLPRARQHPRIHALAHFDTIVTTRDFQVSRGNGEGWQACHPGAPLPAWLSVFRLPGHAMLNFASAVVWTHDGKHEVVLNAPHGIRADEASVRALFARDDEEGDERVEALAMLAALKDSFAFGMATTMGLKGVLALEGVVRLRYWVRSHDAELKYTGVVMMTTYDVPYKLEDGMVAAVEAGAVDTCRRPNLVEVENGASFVLV